MITAQIIECINNSKSFLITTHINPDGDAIGSELSLANLLLDMGKDVRVINHSATPDFLQFLDPYSFIKCFNNMSDPVYIESVDTIICVDFNKLSRAGLLEKYIRDSKAFKICIDHHTDPELFFDLQYIDPEYSATGEIIYDIMKNAGIKLNIKNTPELIYSAIMTDTGSFKYNRTTSRVHLIAAELIELGVNPTYIADMIYNQYSIQHNIILGKALASSIISEDKKVNCMFITRKEMEEILGNEDEVEGIVNHALSVKGIKIGVFISPVSDGIKINFRSKGSLAINGLAAEFGGGGHINAAGARIKDAEVEEYVPLVMKAASNYTK